MNDIAIYGAGGFGKEIYCLIKRINRSGGDWNIIGFFDDDPTAGARVSHYGKYLGNCDDLNNHSQRLAVVLAFGNPQILKKVRNRIHSSNIYFPNIISPDFGISDPDTFSIGEGNIIAWKCAVSCDVKIGNFNVFNGEIVFGHDSSVGDFNVVMPDVRISGEVSIGNENLLGVGSIIIQQIQIGNNVKIGAGAVLLTKPKNGGLYLGNPAKLFKI